MHLSKRDETGRNLGDFYLEILVRVADQWVQQSWVVRVASPGFPVFEAVLTSQTFEQQRLFVSPYDADDWVVCSR